VFVDDSFGEGGKVCVRFRVEGVRRGPTGAEETHETSVYGIFLVEHGKGRCYSDFMDPFHFYII
jgi:hypothetical protein